LLAVTNAIGVVAVAFPLLINLQRGFPLSLDRTALIAGGLYWRWASQAAHAGGAGPGRRDKPNGGGWGRNMGRIHPRLGLWGS
jgi:hypothetical protein